MKHRFKFLKLYITLELNGEWGGAPFIGKLIELVTLRVYIACSIFAQNTATIRMIKAILLHLFLSYSACVNSYVYVLRCKSGLTHKPTTATMATATVAATTAEQTVDSPIRMEKKNKGIQLCQKPQWT